MFLNELAADGWRLAFQQLTIEQTATLYLRCIDPMNFGGLSAVC